MLLKITETKRKVHIIHEFHVTESRNLGYFSLYYAVLLKRNPLQGYFFRTFLNSIYMSLFLQIFVLIAVNLKKL